MRSNIYYISDYQQRRKKKESEEPIQLPRWMVIGTLLNALSMLVVSSVFVILCFQAPEHRWLGIFIGICVALFLFYHVVKMILIYIEKQMAHEQGYMQSLITLNTGILLMGLLLWTITEDKSFFVYVGLFACIGFLLYNLFLLISWEEIKRYIHS